MNIFCQSLDPSLYRGSTVLNFIYLLFKKWGSPFALRGHRRTGRGGEGGCSPPKFWEPQIFLGSERKFGQSQFLNTSPCLFNLTILKT